MNSQQHTQSLFLPSPCVCMWKHFHPFLSFFFMPGKPCLPREPSLAKEGYEKERKKGRIEIYVYTVRAHGKRGISGQNKSGVYAGQEEWLLSRWMHASSVFPLLKLCSLLTRRQRGPYSPSQPFSVSQTMQQPGILLSFLPSLKTNEPLKSSRSARSQVPTPSAGEGHFIA